MKPVLAESGRAGVAAMQERKMAGTPFPLVLLDASDAGHGRILRGRRDQEGSGAGGGHRLDADLRRDSRETGRAAGRWGLPAYLMKPISQAELLEAILAVLGMPSRRPESASRGHASLPAREPAKAAHSPGRGQQGQPDGRRAPARKARPHGGHRRERERSAGRPGRARLRRIRSDPDGCADARHGWFRGHRDHP